MASISPLTDGEYQVTRQDGSTFRVRLAAGPVTGRAAAASTIHADGSVHLTVSDRATDLVVDRALAHEIAEAAAVDQASPGSTPTGPAPETAGQPVQRLTPGDLAELLVAAHQVETADRWSRRPATREFHALVERLGLRPGMLGAQQRTDALPAPVRAALTGALDGRAGDAGHHPVEQTSRLNDQRRADLDGRSAQSDPDRTGSTDPSADPAVTGPRPTGLPRLRAYLATYGTAALVTGGVAVATIVGFAANPAAAVTGVVIASVGAVATAISTGPAKWAAKRISLAAKDQRARYDARVAARAEVEQQIRDTAAIAERVEAVRIGDGPVGGPSTTGVSGQLEGIRGRLAQGQRVRSAMGGLFNARPAVDHDQTRSHEQAGNRDEQAGNRDDQAGNREQAAGFGLTPHERGRMAELRTLAARIDATSGFARHRAVRELHALLNDLGVRSGTPGADQRRQWLPGEVQTIVDRFGERRLTGAQSLLQVLTGRHPLETGRPPAVAPWWVSVVEAIPGLARGAATGMVAGVVLNNLTLGVSGIVGAAVGAAVSTVQDPVMSRIEAAATDLRDGSIPDLDAGPELLAAALAELDGPLAEVSSGIEPASARLASVEARLADLNERLRESQRRRSRLPGGRTLRSGDQPGSQGNQSSGADPGSAERTPEGAGGRDRTISEPGGRTIDPVGLSDSDRSALERLRLLSAEHGAASRFRRPGLARQIAARLTELGLHSGVPGADQRRALLPSDLQSMVERFGRPGPIAIGERLAAVRAERDADPESANPRSSKLAATAVEQGAGPAVRVGATVGAASVLKVLSSIRGDLVNTGANPLISTLRDGLLRRLESRASKARSTWDSAHPVDGIDPTGRVLTDAASAAINAKAAELADLTRRVAATAEAISTLTAEIDASRRRTGRIGSLLTRTTAGRATDQTTNPVQTTNADQTTDPTTEADQRTDQTPIPDPGPDSADPVVASRPTRADIAELLAAADQVRLADRWSRRQALRELHALIDRLGLRAGMLGAESRVSGLPDPARSAVAEFGYPLDARPTRADAFIASQRGTDQGRPTGLPRLRTYLVSGAASSLVTGAATVVTAVLLGSPATVLLGATAAVTVLTSGMIKWVGKRLALTAAHRTARFAARVEARSTAQETEAVIDGVRGSLDALGAQARALDQNLTAVEAAAGELGSRLAETNRRRGRLGRALPGSGPVPGSPAASRTAPDPVTAIGVAGTAFSGRFSPYPSPAAVLDAAFRVLADAATGPAAAALVSGVSAIVALGDGRFEIRPQHGRPFRIQIRSEQLGDVRTGRGQDVAANTRRTGLNDYTIRLADRLTPAAVPEALAHELREVTALRSGPLRQRLLARLRPDTLTAAGTLPTPGRLSGHDLGTLAQLDLRGRDWAALRGSGWPWVRVVFESAALIRHLGIDPGNLASSARLAQIRAENAVSAETWNLLSGLAGQGHLTPVEQQVIRIAGQLAVIPAGQGDALGLYTAWGHAVRQIAGQIGQPEARTEFVAGFVNDLDPAHLTRLHGRDPSLVNQLIAELPAGYQPLGTVDAYRLRQLADEYQAAGRSQTPDNVRLGIRRRLSELTERYQAHRSVPFGARILANIPPDVRAFLDYLAVPAVSPQEVQAAVQAAAARAAAAAAAATTPGAPPQTNADLRAADLAANLVAQGQPLSGQQLRDRLDQLAVEGERAVTILPRLPHLAGRIVDLDQAALARVAAVDPQLAQRVAAEGVYVNLRGIVDLSPFAASGFAQVRLGPVDPHHDRSTRAGCEALLLEDQRRTRGVYCYAYSSYPPLTAILASHALVHVGDGRSMLPVLADLAAAVSTLDRSSGGRPATAAQVAGGPGGRAWQPSTGPIRVMADHPSLQPVDGATVIYGTPLDGPAGRLPLWNGPVSPRQLGQGAIGDCGLIAPLRGVARHQPQVLPAVVMENGDGTYTVRVHETRIEHGRAVVTGRMIEVRVTADLPVYAGQPDQCSYGEPSGAAWGPIIEKAMAVLGQLWDNQRQAEWQGQWYGHQVAESQQSGATPPDVFQAAPTGYSEIGTGTSPLRQAEYLTRLTGRPATVSTFDTSPNAVAATERRLAELLAAGSPVLVHTLPANLCPQLQGTSLPHGLMELHAYEVVAVDQGWVWLSNPWNSRHPAPMPVADLLSLMGNQFIHLELPTQPSSQPALPQQTGRRPGPPPVIARATVPSPEVEGLAASGGVTERSDQRDREPSRPVGRARPARPVGVPDPRVPGGGGSGVQSTAGSGQHSVVGGRRVTRPESIAIGYYLLGDFSGRLVGVLVIASCGESTVSVWQTAGTGGWQYASGAVTPAGCQAATVDRAGADRAARQVLGQPLPPESWFLALAGSAVTEE